MIPRLVTTAPSQWKKLRMSAPPTPGNRYLLPPLIPTTSCGNTGPTMMTSSYSNSRAFTSTGTSMANKPPERARISSAGMTPNRRKAAGLSHSWLKNRTFEYVAHHSSRVISNRWQIAASGIGGCVPRAIKISKADATAPNSANRALNIVPIGAVRVPSGMMSNTFLPRYSAAGQARATNSATSASVTSFPGAALVS